MIYLADMLWIEARKALRSRLPWFTAGGTLVMPLGIGFLIFVATHPEIAGRLGLVSAKANLVAYATTSWPIYLGLLGQMIAAGGSLVTCLIIAWVFGREFADGTLKDLLAVPVPRASIVLAKFAVTAVWAAGVIGLMIVTGLVLGAAMGLPQGSTDVVLLGIIHALVATGLVIASALPFAFFASAGRGYLPPIGAAILALILANLVVVLGWGAYFPWAVPGLYAQGQGELGLLSFAIVLLTGVGGMLGTHLWWLYADQSR